MLLGDQISPVQITAAEAALTKFVIEFEKIYGLRRCSFNMHCLTHLAYSVKNCGPLWATSAFMFEAQNHNLLKMFHGTQHVAKQIAETFLLTRRRIALTQSCENGDCCPSVLHLLEKLQCTRQLAQGKKYANVEALGKPIRIEFVCI